uniref:Phosphoinositide phospholipase C n=1 Tax=Cyprinus carpio TaxID=7962 RepID=A0A8C1TED9_CYPCA
MPTEKKISSASDCINSMVDGSELRKVRSNSRVYYRYFLLDADMQSLRWEPSKKESDKAKIDVKSIKEVRTGKNTDTFRTNGNSDQISEDCAFSIIYGENYESLDLVANSADVANIWVTGLSSQDNMRASWLGDLFDEADVIGGKCIRLCSAVQLIKKLSPGLKNVKIELKFKELHKAKDKIGSDVTKEEFIEVFHDLCTRPEIYFLLVQFSSNKEFLDTKDLMIFLEAEQGMAKVSEDISVEIIQKYEPSKEGQLKGWLSLDGFTNYLMSADCHIFDPEQKIVCQDMNQPLSHYYINSSHNTYLIEDQFRGPSDITGYIRALKMGCRSVELDVWDGPDNEPVIYTGHTMTSHIVFRSVIDVINKYAFVASEFPLILCLENHCSLKQQKVMFQHLKKILGDKIHTDPPNLEDSYLPSPSDLKGKILLKGKKLASNCIGSEGEVTDEDEGNQKHWELCSFNEVFASRCATDHPGEFVNYNKKFLARVYPSPMRIDSSNMNPQDFWKCGCQIVAMNYQTPGLMMDLNIGWFRQNGNCGYVLRPAIMREQVSYFSANTKDSVPGVSPQLLHIKIISGQNFPKPKGSGAKVTVASNKVRIAHFSFRIFYIIVKKNKNSIVEKKNAIVPFKELCGLSAVANLKQCILALSPRLIGPDSSPLLLFNLRDQYPTMEAQGLLPEVLKKVVTAYEMVSTSQTLLESSDSVYERILQVQKAAMEFHEKLHEMAVKEGLKGRKLHKSVESFTWNITILKVITAVY